MDVAEEGFTLEEIHQVLQTIEQPVVTAERLTREFERTQADIEAQLAELVEAGDLNRLDVQSDPIVYYPSELAKLAQTERVVPFPDRREIAIDYPKQFTRAQCSQFARLITVEDGRYLYEIRPEDIWGAPYETVDRLLETVHDVLPSPAPNLDRWIKDQWARAGKFKLLTHKDGYTVLEAESESLMGNVAQQKLDDGQLRAPISDTEAWVAEEAVAEVKRVLYEAGYPVQDIRELESGEELNVELELPLRDYQEEWVERFIEAKSGVLVGPPGSGKTVAAMGIMGEIKGETLVLVPSRELASQWENELLMKTTLSEEQVGQYHGGTKRQRPVTIATYQIAGMDKHRQLFESREWGLIIFDEAHHIPSPIYRRATQVQSKYRLGLTASPVRETGDESEIYTLIGPPIGTDWETLFEAGYVAEPEIELQYLPWDTEEVQNEYVSASGHKRRQVAATNPAKIKQVKRLLKQNAGAKMLIFVDYLQQGEDISSATEIPFLSGETPHARREQLLSRFRSGDLTKLIVSRVGDEGIDLPEAEVAIIASGLGGSRRQGAQRAGRTMRPAGKAQVCILATQGSEEEEFVRKRTRYLAGKGARIKETVIEETILQAGQEDRAEET